MISSIGQTQLPPKYKTSLSILCLRLCGALTRHRVESKIRSAAQLAGTISQPNHRRLVSNRSGAQVKKCPQSRKALTSQVDTRRPNTPHSRTEGVAAPRTHQATSPAPLLKNRTTGEAPHSITKKSSRSAAMPPVVTSTKNTRPKKYPRCTTKMPRPTSHSLPPN